MNYKEMLKDPRWQKKRLEILQRDNFTCRDTGATDEELHVHHCWYAKGAPWETPDEYLLTLSASAHKVRQDLESRAKKALGLIMANLDSTDHLAITVDSMERMTASDTDGVIMVDSYRHSDLLCFEFENKKGAS